MSPTPRKNGRNASVDRTNFVASGRGQPAAAPASAPKAVARPRALEREDSQRSVNYSRPMSPGPAPPARPQSAAGWFSSPTVGTGSPRTTITDRQRKPAVAPLVQTQRLEHDIQSAASKPVAKKKKKAVDAPEGDRLANGTMHTGPTGTSVRGAPSPSPAQAPPQAAQPYTTDGTPTKQTNQVPALTAADAAASPPPKNPARFSPARDGARSPISSRPTSMLHKSPSVVREDPEAEDFAERGLSVAKRGTPSRAASVRESPRTISTSEGQVRAYIAPTAQAKQRAASLDIPRDNSSRNTSLSPSRHHAHFSDVVVVNSTVSRHQPPGRSVSPFKSALKHSPSSSIRGNSPAAVPNGVRAPPSDASDTTSLASQDGTLAAQRKKKSARVSFDDGGTTISAPTALATPNSSKPIRRELSPAAVALDSEADETMGPRPALPSFGSVRARKSPSPEAVDKVIGPVPTSVSSTSSSDRPEASNDHVVGAILADDFASKGPNDQGAPLASKSTSSNTSDIASDSESNSTTPQGTRPTENADATHSAATATVAAPASAVRSVDDASAHDHAAPVAATSSTESVAESQSGLSPAVPNISVQPATPGIEEDKPILDSTSYVGNKSANPRYSIPGGWEESEESKSESAVSSRVEPIPSEEPDFDSSDEEEDALLPPDVLAERHSPLLEPIYESDSDKSDAFSDAAEDPSEFDGGFASLDAIVESPSKPNFSNRAVSSPPDSPTTKAPQATQSVAKPSPLASETPVMAAGGDWSHATAYWSSLTRDKKEQMERQAAVEEAAPVSQPPKQKRRVQAPAIGPMPVTESAQLPLESPAIPKSPSEQPEARLPVLKSSMRQAPDPVHTAGDTHMRKSMRSGGSGGGMKTSMRQEHAPRSPVDAVPRSSLQKQHMPSPASSNSLGAATMAVRNQAAAAAAPPKVPVATANDSDSESSFKKQKRRGSVSTVDSQRGHYSMKRSMRGSSVDAGADRRPLSPTPAPRGSGRFSVRSLSPDGSVMGNNRENLRTSLRGGPATDVPTMRGKNSKAMRDSKSPTRFSMSGFSKQNRPASAASVAPPARGGRPSGGFKSRFVDSDDEDDAAAAAPSTGFGFRSRFADSDEEDSPVSRPQKQTHTSLVPVRGIPRKQNRFDEDSTDLDDSEVEGGRTKRPSGRVSNAPVVPSQSDIDAAMAAARRNVAAMNGGREPGVAEEEAKQPAQVVPGLQSNGFGSTTAPATPTKRRGFMGSMLGRRRTSSTASVPQLSYFTSPMTSTAPQSPALQSPPNGKLQRRTTKRTDSNMSAVIPQPPTTREAMMGEQQKVHTPGAASTNSQNWPLAPPPKINGEADRRPATSDGIETTPFRKTMRGGVPVARTPRPELGRRSISGGDLDRTVNKNIHYSEKTGKKKKFGALRNFFGLKD